MAVAELDIDIRTNSQQATSGINGLTRSLSKFSSGTKVATKHTTGLLSALGKVAKMRILRTIVKEIGAAFTEGLKNAVAFSRTINSEMSKSLDRIASSTLSMKNSLGAALGELLQTIEPVLNAVISLVTKVANAISQLFALLGGRLTYLKAGSDAVDEWGSSAKGAGKAAKEWKNQLLGFDEINRLNDTSNSGGGGGSSSAGDFGSGELTGLGEWFLQIGDITKNWWNSLDFSSLIESFEKLKESLKPFIDLVDDALYWAYTEVLLPLAGWTITEAAPALINLLASALDFLYSIIEKLSPVVSWLWENVLKPIGAWLGDVFIEVVNSVSDSLSSLSEKVSSATSLWDFINSLDGKETILVGIATAIALVVTALAGMSILSSVISLVSKLGAVLTSPVALIAALVTGVLLCIQALKSWIETGELSNEMLLKLEAGILLIGVAISLLTGGWIPLVIAAVVGLVVAVIDSWDEIKQWFSDFWEGLKEGASKCWNWVVGVFEDAINGIIDGINWLIRQINKVSGVLGLEIGEVGHVSWKSDAYATGGFPATGELFVAREAGAEMVGSIGGHTAVANNDQIVEAVSKGVAEAVSAVMGNGSQSIAVYLDGRQLSNAVTKHQQMSNRAMGVGYGF